MDPISRSARPVPNRALQAPAQELQAWTRRELERLRAPGEGKLDSVGRLRVLLDEPSQGAPGTGKTLAAEVIATELGRKLLPVNLGEHLSKWIGETEKNLASLFSRAEEQGAVLFFDEADALFGKRTEVRDSHDRYANEEVSYLLAQLQQDRVPLLFATRHPVQESESSGLTIRRIGDDD